MTVASKSDFDDKSPSEDLAGHRPIRSVTTRSLLVNLDNDLSSRERYQSEDQIDTLVIPAVQTRSLPAIRIAYRDASPYVMPNTLWQSDKQTANKKRAAPLGLRILVAFLSVLLLVSACALGALHSQPRWFVGFRNFVTPSQPTTGHVRLVVSSPNATSFDVATGSYAIVVAVDHPCWIVVKSPISSAVPVVEKTFAPSSGPISIPVHGSSSITFAAQIASFSIVSGSKVLDSVKSPKLDVAYTFLTKST